MDNEPLHLDTVADQLKRITEADEGKPRAAVVILGAGMAGLSAAYELIHRGHTVRIIEASDRVGGRVRTKRFGSGEYHELGAMRIPASHDYTRHYVDQAGLTGDLRRFVTAHKELNCFYDLRGQVDRIRNARHRVLPEFRLSGAEWTIASRAPAPAVFGTYLGRLLRQLTAEDKRSLFAESPLTETAAKLDTMTLGNFLDSSVEGADTKELIGAVTGLEVWWNKSLTMVLRDELLATGDGLQEICGGMDRLPNALADKIDRQHIQFNTEVLAIGRRDQGVDLRLKNQSGELVEEQADHVICTIPFGVLRRMKLSGLSALKMRAIRNLSYSASAKVLLHCTERFWEQGGPQERILGGASFSDGITRATYYPSDHAPPAPAGFTAAAPRPLGFRGLYSTFGDENRGSPPTAFTASPGPGVLVGSYCWGRDALRLGVLSRNERAEAVMDAVERFHPMLRNHVDDHDSVFWDSEPWARGAFCFMNPDDMRSYYHGAIRPEGDLHFAGEHCSLDQAWIQGAVISGLRAVEEIVSQ